MVKSWTPVRFPPWTKTPKLVWTEGNRLVATFNDLEWRWADVRTGEILEGSFTPLFWMDLPDDPTIKEIDYEKKEAAKKCEN
jgi:hypothetical protein